MIRNFLIRLTGKPIIQISAPNYIIEGVPTEIMVRVDGGLLQWIKIGNSPRRINAYSSFSVVVYKEVTIEVFSTSLFKKATSKINLKATVYSSDICKRVNSQLLNVRVMPNQQKEIGLMSKPLLRSQKIKFINKFPVLKIKSLKDEPRLL